MGKGIEFLVLFVLMAMILLASQSRRRGRGDGTVWYDYRKRPATMADAIVMLVIAALFAMVRGVQIARTY